MTDCNDWLRNPWLKPLTLVAYVVPLFIYLVPRVGGVNWKESSYIACARILLINIGSSQTFTLEVQVIHLKRIGNFTKSTIFFSREFESSKIGDFCFNGQLTLAQTNTSPWK